MTNIKYRMVVTLKGKSEVWLGRDTSGSWDDVSACFYELYKSCRVYFMCCSFCSTYIIMKSFSSFICFLLRIRVYPLYCRWAFGLFPVAAYYEQWGYKFFVHISSRCICAQVSWVCFCWSEIVGSEGMPIFIFTRKP